jgi:ABC-type glutathione transport system ATPase component
MRRAAAGAPAVKDDPAIYPPAELREKLAMQAGGFGRADSRHYARLAKIQDGTVGGARHVGRPAQPSKRSRGRIPTARPYVQVDRICKSFGDFKAVDDVSLKIYKGEIFCLLGASGCGKTTLLRMLGGFETPTSGKDFIDGEDMTGVPPYERPVNMMFQSYALFPHMNVEQNVAFG